MEEREREGGRKREKEREGGRERERKREKERFCLSLTLLLLFITECIELKCTSLVRCKLILITLFLPQPCPEIDFLMGSYVVVFSSLDLLLSVTAAVSKEAWDADHCQQAPTEFVEKQI